MAVIELFAAPNEFASGSTDFSLCSFERKTVVIAATDWLKSARALRQEGHVYRIRDERRRPPSGGQC
jgi:hypothetical protein